MTIRLKSHWQREQIARRRRGASSPKKGRRNAFTFRRLMHMRLSAISVCLSQEAIGLQLLKEVIAFVVHEDKGGEVFYFNLPNRFHS